MQKFLVSIVSHGHSSFILKNESLVTIAKHPQIEVLLKDNLKDLELQTFSEASGFHYLTSPEVLGFGANNNFVFDYCKSLNCSAVDSWFIVLNPDVEITTSEFYKLIDILASAEDDFYAPNLYKDTEFLTPENSLRKFPKILDLFNPVLLSPINRPYDKNKVENFAKVDWASGAFLCIRFSRFDFVKGFSPKYFMYFEDVDLCYRLRKEGVHLRFLKEVKAIHKGAYQNRKLFSQHFRWYFKSLLQFIFFKSWK